MTIELDRLEEPELRYLLALAVEQRDAVMRRPEFSQVFQELAGAADDEINRRFSPHVRNAENAALNRLWSGNPAPSGGWVGKDLNTK